MLTDVERAQLQAQLREIVRDEERKVADAIDRRRAALDHPGAHLIDLRGAPLRMR